MGALCCKKITEEQLAYLAEYSQKLGLAFQVMDDVLDCEQDSATLGKTAGKDEEQNKPTYVKLMGLKQARAYADQLIEDALNILEPFGDKAHKLRCLARFVTHRNY